MRRRPAARRPRSRRAVSDHALQLKIALEALGCLAGAGSAYAGMKMIAGIDARQRARYDEQHRDEQATLDDEQER